MSIVVVIIIIIYKRMNNKILYNEKLGRACVYMWKIKTYGKSKFYSSVHFQYLRNLVAKGLFSIYLTIEKLHSFYCGISFPG
jgi:hypothetical protein